MSRVELTEAGAKLAIDPSGGYIDEYSVNGQAILFSAEINGKRRATHVCLPNFGPDASGQWEQHGFGRKVVWQVTEATKNSVILEYAIKQGLYTGLQCRLEYTITSSQLFMKLVCHNNSDQALWLAPGFHPYFTVPQGVEELQFDGDTYQIDSLAGSEYLATDRPKHQAVLGKRRIQFTSDNLQTFVLWSEEPSRFVCIEPTLNGNSFLDNSTPPEKELLASQATSSYSATVDVLEI